MKKYKVEYEQREKFIIDVYARNEEEASDKAEELWGKGDYQETGDVDVEMGNIYDVTNTDDPFHPTIEKECSHEWEYTDCPSNECGNCGRKATQSIGEDMNRCERCIND